MPNGVPTSEHPNFEPSHAYLILQGLEQRMPTEDCPVRLEFRPRMTMRFGSWSRPRSGRPWHTLNISAWLDPAEMEETLRHEYAHALRGKSGHGPEWQKLAYLAGCQQINVNVAPPKLIPWKYLYRCPCGDVLLSVQILPGNRRCRACGIARLVHARFQVLNTDEE